MKKAVLIVCLIAILAASVVGGIAVAANGATLTALSAGQCSVTATSPGSTSLTATSTTYTITITAPPKKTKKKRR